MAYCDGCKQLVGASSKVGPHADLLELGRARYKSQGYRPAVRERYRCKTCATPWERDVDASDPDASWEATGP
jgi:hypothetical protein